MSWDEVSDEHGLRNFEDMLPKQKKRISKKIGCFFKWRESITLQMEFLLTWMHFVPHTEGKILINIVYLNTIQDEAETILRSRIVKRIV